jgi:hypothetical protein
LRGMRTRARHRCGRAGREGHAYGGGEQTVARARGTRQGEVGARGGGGGRRGRGQTRLRDGEMIESRSDDNNVGSRRWRGARARAGDPGRGKLTRVADLVHFDRSWDMWGRSGPGWVRGAGGGACAGLPSRRGRRAKDERARSSRRLIEIFYFALRRRCPAPAQLYSTTYSVRINGPTTSVACAPRPMFMHALRKVVLGQGSPSLSRSRSSPRLPRLVRRLSPRLADRGLTAHGADDDPEGMAPPHAAHDGDDDDDYDPDAGREHYLDVG